MKDFVRMKNAVRVLLVVSACALAGCGVRRIGYAPLAVPWPPAASAGRRPSLSAYCKDDIDSQSPVLRACRPNIVQTLQESGLFSEIKNGAAGGDFRVDMTFNSPPAGFTIYVYATTILYDRDGRIVDRFLYYDGLLAGDILRFRAQLVQITLNEIVRRRSLEP